MPPAQTAESWRLIFMLVLLPQLRDLFCGDARRLRAEARCDVVRNRGDLHIGISVAEGRHENLSTWSVARRTMQHHLGHVDRGRIVDRAHAGQGGIASERACT